MSDAEGDPSRTDAPEITLDDVGPVTASMAQLRAEAAGGWIDVTPVGIDVAPPPSLWARINARTSTTPRITWTAPHTTSRSRVAPSELGIEHPAARRALPLLADRGHVLPSGWVRTQDHPYRGLVVVLPPDADDEAVISWALTALIELCGPDRPTLWTARVHRGR